MGQLDPAIVLTALFPLFFAALWCGLIRLFATLGGWRRLAAVYPAREPATGKRFCCESGKFGWVSYGNCLVIYSSADGIYVSILLPFRVGHSPLFIPWDAIYNARGRRFLWMESVAFDVGSPARGAVGDFA